MRRLLKFLHTLGAIGLMGSMAALVVMVIFAPPPTALNQCVWMLGAMSQIAKWIVMPSMVLTLIAGLLAIAANYAFHEAGWAWVKAISGILIFEGALHVMGSMQDEATLKASALAGKLDPVTLTELFGAERNTIWVLMAVMLANVALGIWRPRMPRLPV